jgi:serine/threonine protein kinase
MQDELRIGASLGPYRIESEVGRGGMGVVYRARQETALIQRTVALKVLSPVLSTDDNFRRRFANEALHAASIDHEHIVPIYDAGEINGHLFLAMRYVEGTDLATLLRRVQRLEPRRALGIVRQAGRALDAAHRSGLIHRDVKPANMLIASGAGRDATDHVYLGDFGLTKAASSRTELTKPGHFLGTLDYIAPEHIAGERLSPAVDIYALGCVLYQCLVGLPPFVKESEVALIHAHLNAPPPRITSVRPDLPPALDGIIGRALSKDPDRRYASCAELVAAAEAALREPSRPRGQWTPSPPRTPTDPHRRGAGTVVPGRRTGGATGSRQASARRRHPSAGYGSDGFGWWQANPWLVVLGVGAVVVGLVIGAIVFR